MAPPLFKRKVDKMKKGVQALVLMSGVASLPALPSYFSFLPISKELKKRFTVDKPVSNPNPALPARRTQSMSVLPARNLLFSSSPDDDDFAEFEAEASRFEAHRAGLILQMEQSASSASLPSTIASNSSSTSRHGRYADLSIHNQQHEKGASSSSNSRYPGLASHASKNLPNQMFNRTQPHHSAGRARRIQSAPSVALNYLPPKLLDDLDAWDTDDFTLNEWVVPEVREKAIRQQQAKPEVEDWDDDFEVDEDQEDLEVPNYMQSIQNKFKHDMLHMRQFALHIQDLKAIQSNAVELEVSLMKHYADDIEMMKMTEEELFSQINLLIQLADYQEDNENCLPLTNNDLVTLNRMISHSLASSSRNTDTKNLEFGNEMMTKLLEAIPPLKKDLVSYVGQLRDLL